MSKVMIKQAIEQLNTVSSAIEHLKAEINRISSELPENPVVMEMYGVGTPLVPQLIAEIEDITRFNRHEKLTTFAGADPGADQSGKYEAQSVPTSKRSSPHLRKTLFQIMERFIQTKPVENLLYIFMNKKRAESKPYYVYMTAGVNRFL